MFNAPGIANMTHTVLNLNGTDVLATDKEIAALNILMETRKGGFASVNGYKPSTNWVEAPTQNIQFMSRVSTERLYNRRVKALETLTFADVANHIASDTKLAAMSHTDLLALFNDRRQMEVDSMVKTLEGDRSDAHRQGHDRCYVHVTQGVKVNLVTEKGADGLKHPVLTNGLPTVASIMVSALFLNVTTVMEGVRKVVNSGAPVRMSNIIAKAVDKPGLSIKMLSLKPDNFDTLTIDKQTILPEHIHEFVA
jgi:hypothetical protein